MKLDLGGQKRSLSRANIRSLRASLEPSVAIAVSQGRERDETAKVRRQPMWRRAAIGRRQSILVTGEIGVDVPPGHVIDAAG